MEPKNQEANFKTWLSAQEAANFLCIAPGTLRNWTSKGKVPYHKIKGGRRGRNIYNRQDLEQLISVKMGGYNFGNKT